MRRPLMFALAMFLASPLTANAHHAWVLPSQTVLSGSEPLVTFDAAISNDLFYFNHHAMQLDSLVITAPDGSTVEADNKAVLKYRSVFDLPLQQKGTYRVAIVRANVMASWEENGETKRWRGSAKDMAANVPANAEKLTVSESVSRIETFVTNGAPSEEALKPTGKGIELVPVTHPNDLYSGETAKFKLLVNGKPGKNLNVTVIRGGIRYRDSQDEMHLTSGEDGEVAVEFKEPGMYWLETNNRPPRPAGSAGQGPGAGGPVAGGPGAGGPGGPRVGGGPGAGGAGGPGAGGPPGGGRGQGMSYTATLEVLPK